MRVGVLLGRVLLCGSVILACSSKDDDDEEEGALACNQSAAECRASFADTYQGAYTGDASGSLILSADESGDVVGTVTHSDGSSSAIFGDVNQFGKITGETDDGTRFVGQIDENGRVTGTWEGPGGKGTFAATGSTASVPGPSGTGGSGSGSGGASFGGSPSVPQGGSSTGNPFENDPRFTPSIDAVCTATAKCGDDPLECAELMLEIRELTALAGCIEELNAFFTCAVASGQCDVSVVCAAEDDAFAVCLGN